MTDEEKALVADYLFEEGKRRIDCAGSRSVDWYARLFHEMLSELDPEKAKALRKCYEEAW